MIIEEFKDMKIAYIRRTGKYGAENKQLMEQLKDYLKSNDLFKEDTTILGIALDNPLLTPENEQRYDVGMIITGRENIVIYLFAALIVVVTPYLRFHIQNRMCLIFGRILEH